MKIRCRPHPPTPRGHALAHMGVVFAGPSWDLEGTHAISEHVSPARFQASVKLPTLSREHLQPLDLIVPQTQRG